MFKRCKSRGYLARFLTVPEHLYVTTFFIGIQHYLKDKPIRHGFVHIPLLPEQAVNGSQPSMSLEMIVEGLRLVAQVCIANENDILVSGGSIC
ncbi:hypothetical protein VDIAB_110078 [Vibrio diabolicus]|nr:hypothetical protein VDIAB_110078 [Vibrio diabolicus]